MGLTSLREKLRLDHLSGADLHRVVEGGLVCSGVRRAKVSIVNGEHDAATHLVGAKGRVRDEVSGSVLAREGCGRRGCEDDLVRGG